MFDVHDWLGLNIAARLRHTGFHASTHVGVGIANIELATGDVERPTIERDAFGQAGDGVFVAV